LNGPAAERKTSLQVVAALIGQNGKILACQRRRGTRFELFWEFPGGKVEPGEQLEDALARELGEELGVTSQVGRELFRAHHTYAETNIPLEIIFFAVTVGDPTAIRNLEFERIEWRTPQSLPELNFLAADRELVAKLAGGEMRVDFAD
jgi:mutator protein MutT